jgi:hypothetical protein
MIYTKIRRNHTHKILTFYYSPATAARCGEGMGSKREGVIQKFGEVEVWRSLVTV